MPYEHVSEHVNQFHKPHISPTSILWIFISLTTQNNYLMPQTCRLCKNCEFADIHSKSEKFSTFPTNDMKLRTRGECAPVRVPTQRPLIPSFTSVVGQVKNFSPCPRIFKSIISCFRMRNSFLRIVTVFLKHRVHIFFHKSQFFLYIYIYIYIYQLPVLYCLIQAYCGRMLKSIILYFRVSNSFPKSVTVFLKHRVHTFSIKVKLFRYYVSITSIILYKYRPFADVCLNPLFYVLE